MRRQEVVLQFSDTALRNPEFCQTFLDNLLAGAHDCDMDINGNPTVNETNGVPSGAIIEYMGEAANIGMVAGALGTTARITKIEYPDLPEVWIHQDNSKKNVKGNVISLDFIE